MSLGLNTPQAFPAFPFLPYDIQLLLMRHLYENIEARRVTVVESPTGTVRFRVLAISVYFLVLSVLVALGLSSSDKRLAFSILMRIPFGIILFSG